MERGKVGTRSYYKQRSVCKEEVIITCIYPTESGGRSDEVVIISYEAIATSHLSTIKYKYLVSKVRVRLRKAKTEKESN